MTKEPKRNVYVGHRYVPKIMGEWEKTETYEGLSIVTHQGASYTSKKRVPKGIDILDKEYWVITGNYDAQVDYYRDEVRKFQDGLDGVAGDITQLETDLNDDMNSLRLDVTQDLSDLENTVDSKLDYIEGSLTNDMIDLENDLSSAMNQLETETDNKISEIDEKTSNKIKYLFKDGNMTLWNMQKRKRTSDKSYVSVQGSCFIGGKGDNMEYALAFLPTDGNPTNKGMVLTTRSNNMIDFSGGTAFDLYHANGMDYNPETNSIYVAHANTVITGGTEHNNKVTELTKNGKTRIREITPTGLPSGRRVKYFSYDKTTGKKYLGDDYGVYEVDNDLNVLKVINFSEEFTEFKSWGLGQTATVHKNFIFYLTMGSPTIAVFDIEGNLITMMELPKFTSEGVFIGEEPQSLFFDNEDNLYLTTRQTAIDFDLENYYTRIFKMTPFYGKSSDNFVGSHNTRTVNSIYVTSKPTSPFQTGSKNYPFHSLDEAIIYAQTAESQKGFQVRIYLEEGKYPRSDLRTNGLRISLIGLDDGAEIEALRLYGFDINLSNIKITEPHHDYSLYLENSNVVLNGVKIDGKGKSYGIRIEEGSILYGKNGQGNQITNCTTGIYANSSIIIGNRYSLGLGSHNKPVKLTSSGFAPMIDIE